MSTHSVAQRLIQRRSARPKGARMGRNQNQGSNSGSKVGSRISSDVEDEFEREMNTFVEKLMSGASTPLPGEEGKKLSEEYEAAAMQYVNDATSSHAEAGDASSAEGRKRLGYNFNFEILNTDRRNSSQNMRQSALDRICEGLAAKYDPTMFQLNDLEILIKAFTTGRTTQEITQALRAIALLSALEVDDSVELINQNVLSDALETIKDEERDPNFRASTATSYSLLQAFINSGSQGFGLEDRVRDLVDVANEAFTTDEAAVLCSSAISATGVLLMNISSRNNLIEDILPEIIELLKSNHPDVVNAGGKLVALLYELYDFSYQFDDSAYDDTSATGNGGYRFQIPTLDNQDLFDQINSLANNSTARSSGKGERRSVFKRILAYLEVRLQLINPDNALTDEGRNLALDESIAQIRLSRTKTFPVYTWGQLTLSQGLKWLYGAHISTHLANNTVVKDLVDEAGPEDDPDYPGLSAEAQESQALAHEIIYDPSQIHENAEIKRTHYIQKQRDNKMAMLTGDE